MQVLIAQILRFVLIMQKFVILLTVVVAAVSAEELAPANRFLLAASRTATSVFLSTTTVPSTVARTCWSSAAGSPTVTNCRRRRGVEELPELNKFDDGLNPLEIKASITKPFAVEPTTAPAVLQFTEENSVVALPVKITEVESSSHQEVEVNGLENCAVARSAFGVTIFYTSTTTVVITSYSFTTSGTSKFQVNGCTPSNFCFSKC